MLSKLRSIDKFGKPFQFHTDPGTDKKNLVRKTGLGSFISILCQVLAVVYFVFLLVEYIAGTIPPVVSQKTVNHTGAVEERFDKNPIDLSILIPMAYKDVDIEEFFSVWLISSGKYENQVTQLTDANPVIKGEQQAYLYQANIASQVILRTNPDSKVDSQHFSIVVQQCQPGSGKTCRSDAELAALLTDDDTQMKVNINFKELDVKTGKLNDKYHEIFSAIDPFLVQAQNVLLLMGEVTTDNGFLWPVPRVQNFIKTYQTHSEFFTATYVEARYGPDIPAYVDCLKEIKVNLAGQQHVNTVVYEKFTQVLAKYTAFLNSLLVIGIIGTLGSEAKIFEMMMDTFIQSYYKKSAADIYEKRKKLEQMEAQKGKTSIDIEKDEKDSKTTFRDIFPGKYNSLMNFHTLKSTLFHQLGAGYHQKHEKQLQEHNYEQEDYLKQDFKQMQQKIYVSQYARVTAQMDFRTLYTEVMEVKAAMQMLFTTEQYAALQYVGRSISLDNNQDLSTLDKKNHLEKIEMVQENPDYRDQQVFNFIKNSEKSNSEIDKKIRDCLVPQVLKAASSDEDLHLINQIESFPEKDAIKKRQTSMHNEEALNSSNGKGEGDKLAKQD